MCEEIKAPSQAPYDDRFKLFLAGTIDQGHSFNWQKYVVDKLQNYDILVFNPRRDNWNENASYMEMDTQINWEQYFLEQADFRVFTFLKYSKSPITLLELGQHITKPGLVCCEEGYYRAHNVELTCDLNMMPHLRSLDDTILHLRKRLDAKLR